MSVVIDASVAISWLLGEVDGLVLVDELMQSEKLFAPPIWRAEVVNVILKKERQRSLTRDTGNAFLTELDSIGIQVQSPPEQSLTEMAEFARPHQLSSYDAAYLQLAVALNARLMTLDRNLQSAAQRLGISLVLDG